MIERALSQGEPPVPLSVGPGQRILTPALDPLPGWIGDESAQTAQALILPPELLEPCATAFISYACNLPASQPPATEAGLLLEPGQPSATIGRDCEAAFLASSLPGGQVSIVSPGGERNAIGFRWACLTAHASIGAVWRCFLNLRTPLESGLWTGTGQDYVFDAGGGSLLNAPNALKVALGGRVLTLIHPEGMLTCFPSRSQRVKVTRLSASGWARRELKSLMLYPDRSIVARFSDGAQRRIATAAPALAAAAIAA